MLRSAQTTIPKQQTISMFCLLCKHNDVLRLVGGYCYMRNAKYEVSVPYNFSSKYIYRIEILMEKTKSIDVYIESDICVLKPIASFLIVCVGAYGWYDSLRFASLLHTTSPPQSRELQSKNFIHYYVD